MALPRSIGAALLPRCSGLLQQSGGLSATVCQPAAAAPSYRRFASDSGDDEITLEVRGELNISCLNGSTRASSARLTTYAQELDIM